MLTGRVKGALYIMTLKKENKTKVQHLNFALKYHDYEIKWKKEILCFIFEGCIQ